VGECAGGEEGGRAEGPEGYEVVLVMRGLREGRTGREKGKVERGREGEEECWDRRPRPVMTWLCSC